MANRAVTHASGAPTSASRGVDPACGSPGSLRCRRSGAASRTIRPMCCPASLAAHAVDVFVASRRRDRGCARTRRCPPARRTTSCGCTTRRRTTSSSISSATRAATISRGPISSSIPGLVVLHDAHLHHARAASLLDRRRTDGLRRRARLQPPGAAARTGRHRRCGLRRTDLLLLADGPQRGAVRPAAGGAQPDRRGRSPRDVRGRPVDVIALGVPDPLASRRPPPRRGTRAVARPPRRAARRVRRARLRRHHAREAHRVRHSRHCGRAPPSP